MNKQFLLIVAGLTLGAIGCDQSQTVGQCGEVVAEAGAPVAPITANEPCASHSDCASDECVPTVEHSLESTGVCWSESFHGCVEVDFEPFVMTAMCGERALVVCQLAPMPEMETFCVPTDGSNAPWISNFLCCDPSFL